MECGRRGRGGWTTTASSVGSAGNALGTIITVASRRWPGSTLCSISSAWGWRRKLSISLSNSWSAYQFWRICAFVQHPLYTPLRTRVSVWNLACSACGFVRLEPSAGTSTTCAFSLSSLEEGSSSKWKPHTLPRRQTRRMTTVQCKVFSLQIREKCVADLVAGSRMHKNLSYTKFKMCH